MSAAETVKIFIVDDDVIFSTSLAHYLSLNPEYQIKKLSSARELMGALHLKPDIITLDFALPDGRGDNLLSRIKELSPDSNVIMISAQEDLQTAIDLFKNGAKDYIKKTPDANKRVWMSIQNLREKIGLKKEIDTLQQEVEKKYNFQNIIIGNSIPIKKVFDLIDKASGTQITVSVTGETGTGKELVAKAIHFNSLRKKNSFVPVNVAAIPKELLESELFGHEKGAFTGANNRRIGKFEEAHNGTLFLDEIGEMDLNLQAKLLRVLQEKELSRIGSNEIIKINARIIVATHRNLQQEVQKGAFREDLYYRLLGLPINLPPLRDRENDILLIAKHFIDGFCKENHLGRKHLSVEAKKKILKYPFPGNIRELKSVIDLACVMADDTEIGEDHIQLNHLATSSLDKNFGTLTLKEYTRQVIQHYLDKFDYDIVKAADKLDIGKSTIYRMIHSNELTVSKRREKV